MTSCGEAMVELLEQAGTTTVFGIPGRPHAGALPRADGARASATSRRATSRAPGSWPTRGRASPGRPGVCTLISGPGLTNAITPIAQAYQDSIPMLVISGVVPALAARPGRDPRPARPAGPAVEGHRVQPLGHGPGGAARRSSAARSTSSARPAAARAHRDRARRAAARRRRRRRPAHPRARRTARRRPAGARRGGRRASRRRSARSSCSAAGPPTRATPRCEIARRIGAPVGLTINGRGAIDHDDPLCLGSALSFAPVDDVLRDADAVLLAGAELSDLELWGLSEPLELHGVIRVDIDARPARSPLPGRDRAAAATRSRRSRSSRGASRRPATAGSRGPRRA